MRISVVLPYYENSRTLIACLNSLMQQSRPPDEVIVVDDGSRDGARACVEGHTWLLPVHLHVTDHKGQSGATNVGITAARGEVVLLTCADIIAERHLVERHLQAHDDAADDIAVVGAIPYAPWVKMTPFMRYMDSGDVQFSFDKIENPEDVSPFYCYAPNFSVGREKLRDVEMFDERFVYGYQDTDLGVRLAEGGTRFVYRPEAIGYHDHPTTVRAFVRRQIAVGDATLHWLEKYNKHADLRKMRMLVADYYPHIKNLQGFVAEAERLEKAVTLRPTLYAALKNELTRQFTLISATAVVAGMADFPERMQQTLGSQFAAVHPQEEMAL